jgi:signal transduction histidine kinase
MAGLSEPKVVLLSLGVILAVLVVSAIISIEVSVRTDHQVDDLAANSLESIRLLGRMGLDVERQQRLTHAHIVSTTAAEHSRIEREIEATRRDYDAADRDYAPLTIYPGEAVAWKHLRADVEAIHEPMERALTLSSQNRDDEARVIMRGTAQLIEQIDRDVTASIQINARNARLARGTVHRLLVSALAYRFALWIFGIVFTIAIGIWVMRLLARAETQRNAALRVLEERTKELDAFAARVAHDLRAPLTSLSVSVDLSMRKPGDANASARIHNGVVRMNSIIEDLLQLSRIGGAKIADVCDPQPAIADAEERFADPIAKQGGTLHVDAAAAHIRCREGLFRQLVSNLTENALKYRRSEVAPQIDLSGRVVGSDYELRVSDNGIGMSANEARQAFDPLFRAHRRREVPGTGLGLSIVKRIVEACGGSASVDSKLGEGTTFLIRLPLA